VTRRPYWERRQLLEGLALEGDYWSTPSHTDGELSGRRSASSAWKAWSPRNAAATTSPAGADGSRPRTGTTGDTRWSSKPLDRHGAKLSLPARSRPKRRLGGAVQSPPLASGKQCGAQTKADYLRAMIPTKEDPQARTQPRLSQRHAQSDTSSVTASATTPCLAPTQPIVAAFVGRAVKAHARGSLFAASMSVRVL